VTCQYAFQLEGTFLACLLLITASEPQTSSEMLSLASSSAGVAAVATALAVAVVLLFRGFTS